LNDPAIDSIKPQQNVEMLIGGTAKSTSKNDLIKDTIQTEDHFHHQQNTDHELSIVQRFFRNYYGKILLHPASKVDLF